MPLRDLLADPMRRIPYGIGVTLLMLAQTGVVGGLGMLLGRPFGLSWTLVLAPLGRVLSFFKDSPAVGVAGVAVLLAFGGATLALSFRRAADAGLRNVHVVWSAVPILQLPTFYLLALAPAGLVDPDPRDRPQGADRGPIAVAVATGALLFLGAVALGTLVFKTYGWILFVVAPAAIGMIVGYLGNRKVDVGLRGTTTLVLASCLFGGVGLLAAAVEGIVCIAMASPLVGGLAVAGGLFARSLARARANSPGGMASSVALLPLLFALEAQTPHTLELETRQSVEIDAPPDAVWRALVDMEPITAPPALPQRLGVAYPISATIEGQGVGARRIGRFSTGTAIETVTAWEPGRRLAFTVVTNPPMLKELSPYDHVHAPHVAGYFVTPLTRFEITPLAGGRSRLLEETRHELRLDPAPYWMPMVRWVVKQNNVRVLTHVKRQAEAG